MIFLTYFAILLFRLKRKEVELTLGKKEQAKGKKVKEEKNKKSKRKLKKGRIVLFIILLLLLIGGSYFGYKVYKNGGGMQGMIATIVGHNENTLKNLDPFYVLILGESTDIALTDTIIVGSYNPKEQKAALLSIPRDTYTGTNTSMATAYQKINTAYRGGEEPENALKAINKITGLDIEYYVIVDTAVLREMVDKIGGVWFDVPINMKYDHHEEKLYIDLKKGNQLIDGAKAEQLVRFRHNNDGSTYPQEYGFEDLGRMRTGREFITEAIKQTMKPENIFKVGDFLEIAHKNIKTNIPLSVAKDYLPYAVNFKTENLLSATLPGTTPSASETNNVSLFIHNKKETKELVDEMFLGIVPEDKEDENKTNTTNSTNTIKNNT